VWTMLLRACQRTGRRAVLRVIYDLRPLRVLEDAEGRRGELRNTFTATEKPAVSVDFIHSDIRLGTSFRSDFLQISFRLSSSMPVGAAAGSGRR
jgi:hypothetical protein